MIQILLDSGGNDRHLKYYFQCTVQANYQLFSTPFVGRNDHQSFPFEALMSILKA